MEQKELKTVLGSLYPYFEKEYSGKTGKKKDVLYMPVSNKQNWWCTCGTENPVTSMTCSDCGIEIRKLATMLTKNHLQELKEKYSKNVNKENNQGKTSTTSHKTKPVVNQEAKSVDKQEAKPVYKQEAKPIDKLETNTIKPSIWKRKKSIAIVSVISFLVIAGIVGTVFFIKHQEQKREEEAAAAAEAEAINNAKNYENNINKLASDIAMTSTTMEYCGSLIHDVWNDAITGEDNERTAPYTDPNYAKRGKMTFEEAWNSIGEHYTFDKALELLFSDEDFSKKISEINESQNTIQKDIQELKNPPEGFEEAYDAAKEYYDAYLEMALLVTDISGSLQSWTTKYNNASSDLKTSYKKMQTYAQI